MYRLSAVIELLDSYRDQPALAATPRFLLNGEPVGPLSKSGARYVLVNLAPGDYVLDVYTTAFRPHRLNFSVSDTQTLSERWLSCALEPNASYDYPPYSTVLRGQLASTVTGEVTVSADYFSARGQARHVQTRCTRDQPYTLALRGNLANPTRVSLRFDTGDGRSREQVIAVTPGRVQHVSGALAV
jgi:hypothetical protein